MSKSNGLLTFKNLFEGFSNFSGFMVIFTYYAIMNPSPPRHLVELCFFPFFAVVVFVFFEKRYASGLSIDQLTLIIISGFIKGGGLAFAWVGFITLDSWYTHPDSPSLEPLFTAQGLISALLLGVQGKLRKMGE